MITNNSKAPSCTCPSGDGSLVHPCPAHPAPVKQAGGDERAALQVALNIVQRATDALGILPGTPFPAGPVLTNRYLETQLSPSPYQWTREVSLCATPSSTKTSPASST